MLLMFQAVVSNPRLVDCMLTPITNDHIKNIDLLWT